MSAAIIFDLDGTLYDSRLLDIENECAAIASIEEKMGVSADRAKAILDTKRQSPTGITSISQAIREIGIEDSEFKDNQLKHMRPEQHLSRDSELVCYIKLLKKNYKLVLLTNTRREIVDRIVNIIGFDRDAFDLIVAGGDGFMPKPSTETLAKILALVGSDAKSSFSVGDRWLVDHQPGISLGINPVQISCRTDLIQWLKEMTQGI
jgi:FMN phosphatase YigB (HAD superfamily)